MRHRRPSHTTIVAYLALFLALGLGTVYAANRINGHSIKPRSTPGNRLKSGSVTGKQVKEGSLNASAFAPSGGAFGHCGIGVSGPCAHTTLRLHRPSRVVAIGNGTWVVVNPAGSPDLSCNLEVDGKVALGPAQLFAASTLQDPADSGPASNGQSFALAGTSKQRIRAGRHKVQLFCGTDSGAVRAATITAFAISAG